MIAAGTLPGDYDTDGDVDAGDYTRWQQQFGTTVAASTGADGNGVVDAVDFTVWRDNVSAIGSANLASSPVPELRGICLALAIYVIALYKIRNRGI